MYSDPIRGNICFITEKCFPGTDTREDEPNERERMTMSRVYNFSAGPAVLPEAVLREAAAEMLDYRGTGMSVMEMSHRSKTY